FPPTKNLLFYKPVNIKQEVITGENLPAHFSTLSIKKYKILENLDIPQLNKINIFAGINNSGKSSLLEAIYLLTNLNNIYAFFESLKIRGKFDAGMEANWVDEQAKETIEIRGIFANREAAVNISRQVEALESLDKSKYLGTIAIDAGYEKEQIKSKTRLFRDTAPQTFTGNFKILCNNVLSNPYAIQDRREQADFYKKSVESKTIDGITKFLKEHVDDGIEWVRNPGGGFKVSHKGFPTAKDLALFGEGMQRIFHIALRFAAARDGVLLIDEMENAVHFQLLADFARLIRELAREFNTQVFITSHSKECIDAFFKDKTESKDLTVYRLSREDRKIQCKFIGGERFAGLIDFMDIDVRGDI
ncbi:MAG: AAA family ATPase, partial [Candidatus Aminicenantes bacterium]|nr:AAA family ATPase [Candidatus Aminicenantes bacterium]